VIEQDTYWRRDPLKFGERLERRYRQRKWSARTLYNIEKEVFLSFYIIRKLIDSGKADPAVSGLNCAITKYPIREGAQPTTDPKTFASTYELLRGSKTGLNLKALCNQFIHSFIFSPFTPFKRDMFGIYFASDSQSKTGLYYITLMKVIEVILSAGRNRLISLKLHRRADGTFRVISR
jgi:hypothetical protein